MVRLFTTLFDKCGVNYTQHHLKSLITDVPYIHSMYGVGVVLAKYNIDYHCVRFDNKDNIRKISTGIIIYKGEFYVVTKVTTTGCVLYSKGIEKLIEFGDLYDGWNGVIMIVTPKKSSIEQNYILNKHNSNIAKLKTIWFCLLSISAIAAGIICNRFIFDITLSLVIVLSILGIGVSYLLLQKQLHIPNKFADRLCGLAKESHCEDVTQSDGATLFGLFKLSEIGASFFAVNLLALLFLPQYAPSYAVISALVLPFSFWSVWYQKFKAKSWCVLCLMTLGLMWLQAAVYLFGGYYAKWSLSHVMPMVLLCVAYGIALFLINKAMALIEKQRSDSAWRREFNILKSQDYVVDAYISNANHFDVTTKNCSSLFFGDTGAQHLITVFSNPYCSPCAMMHDTIAGYPGKNVRIQYVMTYFSEERSVVNKYIIAAYQQLGSEKAWKLMTKWYADGKDQGVDFFIKYNLNIDTEEVIREFEKQRLWAQNDNLYGTPTVMVNGVVIEYPYEVSDYMLFPYEN